MWNACTARHGSTSPGDLEVADARIDAPAPRAVASRDVELVAFRVDHQRPPAIFAFMDADDGRAQGQEALDLGIVVLVSDDKVEMDPVLHRLGLRDRLEEDAPAHACPALVDGVIGMA